MADEVFSQDCVLSWIGVEQMMVDLDIVVFLIEGSALSIGLSLWFKVVWFNMASANHPLAAQIDLCWAL